ncbi:aminopeptidase [Halorhabdus utahensis DSM 12940]|uniref:Aminopeptidase n=1 Tax=Halorhabdus utahensis (strain DSM 12940 / JCM 11049 / AX-2) TaxID=519442 RepID=C7NPG6_HALUD|nr:aminopeptidase [Halorhabdus utahensis]ACV12721.1 aminopeptidase [Halorhabdus utahensis DSM 12940]
MSDTGLRGPAETAVLQCLALESGESCLIVTDDERRPIGEALYAVASETTDDAMIIQYPPGDQHGEEPPEPVATAMASADVVLAPTTKSLTHTRARTDATDAGARVATLPGITEEVFTTGLDVDYTEIHAASERLLDAVEDAAELRVTSPQGTDITVTPGDREWQLDTGIVHEPGQLSNLPAGEIFLSPETADGTIVVTGTMAPHGLLDKAQSIRLEVEDGYVTSIDDDTIREQVETAAEEVGRDAYNLAELGIGTNVGVVQLVGSVLLDEKAGGTVHFAVGDDAGIGGDTDAPIHLDGILRNPTVYADGEEIDLPTP